MSRTRKGTPMRTGFLVALLLIAGSLATVSAGPREQAKRIHDRLVGTPPSAAVLDQMAGLITADPVNGPLQAAEVAMDGNGLPMNPFYNSTLRNFAAPWTNEAQSQFVDLNDYTVTVIGMVRDGEDFSTLLSADIVYHAPGVTPEYSSADNDHYAQLERDGVDLADAGAVVKTAQSIVNGGVIPSAAIAGIQTTRAAAEAFFSAGTNRRMLRFNLVNHMCRDFEELKDPSRTPDRIRRDISRNPGGDSSLFLNNCVACHAGMDPLAQAYAFYNFDEDSGSIEYTAAGPGDPDGVVQEKYNINADAFDLGYITASPDADRWDNYWRQGPNSALGWSGGPTLDANGNGAASLGREITGSRAFAECKVEQVFKTVCLHGPTSAADQAEIQRIADAFRIEQQQAPFTDGSFAGSYNLKRVFAEVASYCKGP